MEAAARDLLKALGSGLETKPPAEPPPAVDPPPASDTGPSADATKATEAEVPSDGAAPATKLDTLALLKSLAEQLDNEPPPPARARPAPPPARPSPDLMARVDRLLLTLERNPKAAWIGIATLAIVVLLAMTALLWDILSPHHEAHEGETPQVVTPSAPQSTPAPQPAPSGQLASDLPSIMSAMKQCDDEATRDRDSIYFLVVPLAPAKGTAEQWLPQGESYDTFVLLSSQVMIDGLKDQTLVPRRVRYSLFLLDGATRNQHNLGTATGVFKASHRDAAWLSSFRIGFDLSGSGANPKWSNEFQRRKGVCYWVNVMFRS